MKVGFVYPLFVERRTLILGVLGCVFHSIRFLLKPAIHDTARPGGFTKDCGREFQPAKGRQVYKNTWPVRWRTGSQQNVTCVCCGVLELHRRVCTCRVNHKSHQSFPYPQPCGGSGNNGLCLIFRHCVLLFAPAFLLFLRGGHWHFFHHAAHFVL